jgi:hypothetical protein
VVVDSLGLMMLCKAGYQLKAGQEDLSQTCQVLKTWQV